MKYFTKAFSWSISLFYLNIAKGGWYKAVATQLFEVIFHSWSVWAVLHFVHTCIITLGRFSFLYVSCIVRAFYSYSESVVNMTDRDREAFSSEGKCCSLSSWEMDEVGVVLLRA